MKVVILCGGQGTRIRAVTEDLPKPMIPIGGLPIVWHVMRYYAHWGHSDFVLCLGYLGRAIKEFFLNYESFTNDLTITLGQGKSLEYHGRHDADGWRITLADTGIEAMTGARIRRVRRYLQGESNFLLTYGDGVGNVDIDALVAFHKSHGKILTVTGVRPPGRFGELAGGPNGQVTEFNEKPQATGGRISGGFFVCRKELFDYLDDAEDLVFEEAPMRRLVRDGEMMMFEHDGFWQPMDTHRDYLLLKRLCDEGRAPWIVWE